jgi:hypothetical protein
LMKLFLPNFLRIKPDVVSFLFVIVTYV